MEKLKSQLESLLLVSSKPLSFKKLGEILKAKPKDIALAIQELAEEYQGHAQGFRLIASNEQAQLVSSPENAELVKAYLKEDLTGELTDPAVETLTIIAYRQPVSKAELEQIRGVNCSLILRNLMIRGLAEAQYDKERAITLYSATMDFLKFLGIGSVRELPDYEKLNSDENLQKLLLNQLAGSQTESIQDQTVKVEVKADRPEIPL